MANDRYPALDADTIAITREALHGYARIAGTWTAAMRKKRKHWWHASLRPSLNGLATGVIYCPVDFELEIDFANSLLLVRTHTSTESKRLTGQSSRELAKWVRGVLVEAGLDEQNAPGDDKHSDTTYPDYSANTAKRLHRALSSVAAALEDLRANMHEEKSPIQVWPHHFDLSMIWLPGYKIEGEDPSDEESSDKQMNFGFVFGDESIPEPYFYVTAYPTPDAMPKLDLPGPANWRTEGFNGAVALYKDVAATKDSHAYLLDLWSVILDAGRKHLPAQH